MEADQRDENSETKNFTLSHSILLKIKGDYMSIGTDFIKCSIQKFEFQKSQAERAMAQLQPEELHIKPAIESNSIAIIMQHLAGNMKSRWTNFLTEDGEKTWRKRDDEFEPGTTDHQQLKQEWETGWSCVWQVLDNLKESDLEKKILIRNQPLTVVDAIIRQIDHYGYHTGQIVFIAKLIRDSNWQHISMPKRRDAGV